MFEKMLVLILLIWSPNIRKISIDRLFPKIQPKL